MSAVRAVLAALVVAVMGCAILGIGMGDAPAERERAPGAAAVRAAQERLEAGGATVLAGERLFAEQGCDRCHSIAAIGANGKLGPRLDTIDDDVDDNLESIEEPRDDIVDGYPEALMPDDFDERLDEGDLFALALFVTTAAGGEVEAEEAGEGAGENEVDDGDDGGRGRGRGRSGGG